MGISLITVGNYSGYMKPFSPLMTALGVATPLQLIPPLMDALKQQPGMAQLLETDAGTAYLLLHAARDSFRLGQHEKGEQILSSLLHSADPKTLSETLTHRRFDTTAPTPPVVKKGGMNIGLQSRLVQEISPSPAAKVPSEKEVEAKVAVIREVRAKFLENVQKVIEQARLQPETKVESSFALSPGLQARVEGRGLDDRDSLRYFRFHLRPRGNFVDKTARYTPEFILEQAFDRFIDYGVTPVDHSTKIREWTPTKELTSIVGFETAQIFEQYGPSRVRVIVITIKQQPILIHYSAEGMTVEAAKLNLPIEMLMDALLRSIALDISSFTKEERGRSEVESNPTSATLGSAKGALLPAWMEHSPWQAMAVRDPLAGGDRMIGFAMFGSGFGSKEEMDAGRDKNPTQPLPVESLDYARSMLRGEEEGFRDLTALIENGDIMAAEMGLEVALFREDFSESDFQEALAVTEKLKADFLSKVEEVFSLSPFDKALILKNYYGFADFEHQTIVDQDPEKWEPFLKLAILAHFLKDVRFEHFKNLEGQPNILTAFALKAPWQKGGKGSCHAMTTLAIDLATAIGLDVRPAASEGHISIRVKIPGFNAMLLEPETQVLLEADFYVRSKRMTTDDFKNGSPVQLLLNPMLLRMETDSEDSVPLTAISRFFPEEAVALSMVAETFLRKGEIAAAERAIEKAITKNLRHLGIFDIAIRIAEASGKTEMLQALQENRDLLVAQRKEGEEILLGRRFLKQRGGDFPHRINFLQRLALKR